MKEKEKNFCIRTGRPCIGGAWDGDDGWGIDCGMGCPIGCPYRSEFPSEEEEKEG